jgi:hypothetical protein
MTCPVSVTSTHWLAAVGFARRYHNRQAKNDMKEVLTKNFWQSVKKAFYDALDGPPAEDTDSKTPGEGNPKASSTSEVPSRPSVTTQQS